MITFSVVNQKGGTGKTTTAVTLAHGLALRGKRVLLVDTDAQGHVARCLGLDKGPGVMQMIQWYQEIVDGLLIVPARERLDMIPSDKTTEPAKRVLGSLDFRERMLAVCLEDLADQYDVAVIDCAPSLDVLHIAALVASKWVIIPTKLDYLAVDGVAEVLLSLANISKSQRGSTAQVLGILPTFYDRTTNETNEQLSRLAKAFPSLVLPPIPVDTKLREAPAYGKTIWEYAPSARSLTGIPTSSRRTIGGYSKFLDTVLERLP